MIVELESRYGTLPTKRVKLVSSKFGYTLPQTTFSRIEKGYSKYNADYYPDLLYYYEGYFDAQGNELPHPSQLSGRKYMPKSLAGRRMSEKQIMVEKWGVAPADVPRLKRLSKELSKWLEMEANGEIEALNPAAHDSWNSPRLKFFYNRQAENAGRRISERDIFGSGGKHPMDFFNIVPNGLAKAANKFRAFQKKYPFLVLQTDPRGNPIYFGSHDYGAFSI